ncbi:MAG TPA: orotate phosphoribosyltransferase [Candidatus Nanoarchaeia archaeon]|nr:orotate phosphoribosyltransferase [Candidatus Nanoarchaeia archaeon]
MEIAKQCAVCGKELVTTSCPICGALVGQQCYNSGTGACTICSSGRKIGKGEDTKQKFY